MQEHIENKMAEISKEGIVELLRQKVMMKQLVGQKTKDVFSMLSILLSDLTKELTGRAKAIDDQVSVSYKERGEFEIEFTLADETLLFVMHTNIFTFDSSHEIWKSPYVKEDKNRAFCGKIFIYNFLSDSFKYNRTNDIGYLIGRIFINKENHFFVEGKKQIGRLYSDFTATEMNEKMLLEIIEATIIYSLEFDPFTPSFETNNEIRVGEVIDASLQSRIATGKRLGFKFMTDTDIQH